MLGQDTPMLPESLPAALRAAGAGVRAVDIVMGGSGLAFCAERTPGHHAGHSSAKAFCLFNNVAIAARHALDHHGLSRVAVLDFDVHHGNGTEDILGRDDRVLFCSSFQHPLYPSTGHEAGGPLHVPVPLPEGTAGPALREAVAAAWWPAIDAYRPEMILLSAGFEGHVFDPMGGLALVEADYAWLTGEVMGLAEGHAARRVVSVLEGGCHHGATARSVVAHLKAMI
jgi:acetoin utilization deacetylase AcuC-like enzyme